MQIEEPPRTLAEAMGHASGWYTRDDGRRAYVPYTEAHPFSAVIGMKGRWHINEQGLQEFIPDA